MNRRRSKGMVVGPSLPPPRPRRREFLTRTNSLPMVLHEKDAGRPLFWFRTPPRPPRPPRFQKEVRFLQPLTRSARDTKEETAASAAPAAVPCSSNAHPMTALPSCPTSTTVDCSDDDDTKICDRSLLGLSIVDTTTSASRKSSKQKCQETLLLAMGLGLF